MYMSDKSKKVYGVEVVPQAIENAKENAELNEVTNAEFIVGEVEKVIPKMYETGIKADAVFVDPPRKGCNITALQTIIDMKVKKTTLFKDYARVISSKAISMIEVEDIDEFIKKKESAIGTRNITVVKHEIYDRVFHKLTVRQEDIDPLGDAERTIIYEWEDN